MNTEPGPDYCLTDCFIAGFVEGADVCHIPHKQTDAILDEILPPDKVSAWSKLIQPLDQSSAHYLGHQLACLLKSVKKGIRNRNDALANAFCLVEAATRGVRNRRWLCN